MTSQVNCIVDNPSDKSSLVDDARVVVPGGVIAMVEPWVTPWSKAIYHGFHYEPFETDRLEWEFPSKGPLSDANGALFLNRFLPRPPGFQNLLPGMENQKH